MDIYRVLKNGEIIPINLQEFTASPEVAFDVFYEDMIKEFPKAAKPENASFFEQIKKDLKNEGARIDYRDIVYSLDHFVSEDEEDKELEDVQ